MKYDDYIEKVAELMDAAKTDALKSAKIAWDSGTINTAKYADNYRLPKIFMQAYATRMKSQFGLLYPDKEALAEIKNLEHFI